jgi:hypothetical protein
MIEERIEDFFATARQRYEILLARRAGTPYPWTDWYEKSVFKGWRFCCVHREDDKTTVWFREHVRSKVHGLRAVQATVAFRWFGKLETGELVKDLLLEGWDPKEVKRRFNSVPWPICTGAYMINTQASEWGQSKVDGLLWCIDKTLAGLPLVFPKWGPSLRRVWRDLQMFPSMGPFFAYEIVSDLRWTDVLGEASDIMTWASAGTGCARGLGHLFPPATFPPATRQRFSHMSEVDQAEMVQVMQKLLLCSQDPHFWPLAWRPWEMREVEHWACEYDKITRVRAGSRLKRRYP